MNESTRSIAASLAAIRRLQTSRHLQRSTSPSQSGQALQMRAAEYRFLEALLHDGDRMRLSDIAASIGVDRPRATRLAQALREAGAVAIAQDPDDARGRLVSLTEAGHTIVNTVDNLRGAWVEQTLQAFDEQEREMLATLLARFVETWAERVGTASDST